MNDDELKQLWQEQTLRDPPSTSQLISAMQNKMTEFRRSLLWRDIREVLACLVLVIVFGGFYFQQHAPMSRLGDLIVIGSAIYIAWKLVYTRRATPPAPPGATVVEALRAELNSVRTQSNLLGSVLWWYLLPLTVGELVFIWGGSANSFSGMAVVNAAVSLFVLAVNAGVYWLNKSARAKGLLPVEAQLKSLLHSAETGEPLNATDGARLRPIVLPLAAAGRVKPVEFKVDFWQIALYGVTGIVGIWFFWMVDLAKNRQGWENTEPPAETFVQTIPVEEANRYFGVTRKIVDLFNAGDYTGVQKLYDPEMSQALPLRQAAEFFTNLAAGFGRIEKFDGPTGHGYQGWTAFRLHCQHGALTMSLVLDADDKISGLYWQPTPRPPVNIKWLVRGIFSWQHLLLLVPFFLAGLFYSWLLQKLTRRAVGISILGVHSRKGQSLLLWAEIAEVRPLRLLNIRSLWLIAASGEKTIIPWTSLERHADLKAAVEASAPPDHPIRKYLSLLRRT